MIRNIIITILLLFTTLNYANAHIDIVYPKTNVKTVNAPTMFFLGNTTNGADFYINSKPVKLWENNFFVEVVPIKYGRNEIKFTSIHDGEKENLIYIINRNPVSGFTKKLAYEEFNKNLIFKSTTIKDNATIRDNPSTNSNRLIDISKNVDLYIAGKQGNYYKIKETGDTDLWVHKSNISPPEPVNEQQNTTISGVKFYSDNNYNYTVFNLTKPVLYTIKQEGNKLVLTLYGVKSYENDGSMQPNYIYTFDRGVTILGYEGYYDGNNFVLKMAKLPSNHNKSEPLKGVNIFIDAGHGGEENGSIGPTRVAEKNVNLAICNKLAELLSQEGANVIMSRTNDVKVTLNNRVKMARENNALFSLSIHSNALPDGKDPYAKHGSEVHYYNENAKQLAQLIVNNLAEDLGINNNGIFRSSFALDRQTNPVSVLIEVAYMINPEEYIKLKDKTYQDKAAESIKKSIKNYIILIQK